MTTECRIEGCENAAAYRGMCHRHYRQWRLTIIGPLPCSIEGCEGVAVVRGRCEEHRRRTDRACSVDGCDRQYKCRGYCNTHYSQWRRGVDPVEPEGGEEMSDSAFLLLLTQRMREHGIPLGGRGDRIGGKK